MRRRDVSFALLTSVATADFVACSGPATKAIAQTAASNTIAPSGQAAITSNQSNASATPSEVPNSSTAATAIPIFERSPAETAAGVVPTNYGYATAPEDIRRLGAIGDGATDNAAVITLAQAIGGSSYFPRGTYRVGSNLSLGRAYAPILEQFATLKPDASATISVAGPVSAGNYRIFDLSNGGSVKLANQVVNATWFGAVPDGDFATGTGTDNTSVLSDALNSLGTSGGGALYVPPGIYRVDGSLHVPDGVSIFGAGKWSTIFFCPSTFSDPAGLFAIVGTDGYPTCIHGLAVLAQTGGSGGNGIVSTKNGFFLRDVWVNGFIQGAGVILSQTDNFLSDFVIEECLYGLEVTQTHVNIADGTFYDNQISGLLVSNGTSAENGRVVVTAVRSSADGQSGFSISKGKRVSIQGCSCTHPNSQRYSVAGVQIDASVDVEVSGFAGFLGATSATAAGIQVSGGSQSVRVTGGCQSGWLDGMRSGLDVGTVGLIVSGGDYSRNGRRGVYIEGGDQIQLVGLGAHNNSTGDAGIYANNTAPNSTHAIIGCIATGQLYGINVNVGTTSSFTSLVGNVTRNNGASGLQVSGIASNVTNTGNC